MAQPEAARCASRATRVGGTHGIENGSSRCVASAPAVRTKLLVGFLAIAALLVLYDVLGLRVLGQANARVERLGTLQAPSATTKRSRPTPPISTGARGAKHRHNPDRAPTPA